ncbi:MAG TPA: 4-(cytidine 5'-diphospho)-2-C-methyl-D-erythritol kinase [bacterium]|nr:4-(cytidine 5'-diphospho)-2-C-methyl-D-erythritol kinase [bacterium]
MLTVQTPAKINPVLEVLNRRPDGYHELALVFQAIGLYDQLSFERKSSGVELNIEGPSDLAVDDSNLIVKAARLFIHEVLNDSTGVKITLRKTIPMAAGLGGGSSDAAATLKGLRWLFETELSDEKMNAMASGLGSDVNFFLTGGAALGTGRGEIITPWKSSGSLPVLLIKPSEGLSTPAVYRSGKASLTSGEKAKNFKTLLAQGDAASISSHLFNGLEPAAFYLRPEVELIKKRLIQEGALGALLSGSGPTVFGIFADMAKASAASQKFEGEGFEIVVTQTIPTGVEKL